VETEGTTVWTWGTVAANHEIGQLKELSGLSDDELYTYDSAGRPAAHSMTWASRTYTVGYNYNAIGKLNQLTYPLAQAQANPFAVLYTYSNGYLSSLQNYTGGIAGTTFWKLTSGVLGMDSWGHVTDETLGTTSAVRIQSAFDGVTSWLNARTAGSGGSLNNLQNLAYQWDLNGNLGQRADQIQSLTEAFNYDNLNRIQTSTLNGAQNLSVAIDNTGNITSRTEGGVTYPYTYDTTHKHAVDTVGSVGTYTYDANGNMATRNGYSLTWASYNLPTNITGSSGVYSTLYYGPDRQRKEQVAKYVSDGQNGTETTIYVAGLYEYQITPGQTHDKYFIQVPGGTQIIYDIQSVSGTQTTYVTADHLGSGNLLLNSAGTVEIKESYSAYGYRRSANWAGPLSATSGDYTTIASTTRRGYTDAFHEMLDNVGLIHMNGRVYDPVIGRFMSPDPIVSQVGDSQRGNPYSYVENKPLTMTDPTGFTSPGTIKCIDFCSGWIPHCLPCRLGYDPGSFIGPDIGSLQGFSFDNGSSGSTSGDWTEGWVDSNGNIVAPPSETDNNGNGSTGGTSNTSNTGADNSTANTSNTEGPAGEGPTPQGGVTPNNTGVSISWTLQPTITNDSGGFVGAAAFTVPAGTSGVLIQQMTFGSQVPTYWEGWTVTNGTVDQRDATGANDVFRAPSAAYSPATGQLQFYPGATMNNFPELMPGGTFMAASPSHTLPSTYNQPTNWTSTGALLHQIVVFPAPTPSGFTITSTPK
jgi:RHS repeat-associated protein